MFQDELEEKKYVFLGDQDQNNVVVMIVSTEYMETVEMEKRASVMTDAYWFWGPNIFS